MSIRQFFLLFFLLSIYSGSSQETFPVNGVHDERDIYHAFKNARIHISPQEVIDAGVLVIRNGKIVSVGVGTPIPEGSVVYDCEGQNIYASFIDPDAKVDAKKKEAKNKKDKKQEELFKPANWNPAIRPEQKLRLTKALPKKTHEDWLSSGYGLLNVHTRDGIMRGTSIVLTLGESSPNKAILKDQAANHFSFSKGTSKTAYPTSHIGAIALIRQTLYDAQWYGRERESLETNSSLQALQNISERPSIFELNHPLSIRNVNDIAQEFDLSFVLRGTGKEYLVLEELLPETKIIAPLTLPKAFDIEDPYVARMISLEQLRHWELAPFNLKLLTEAGVEVSLTRDTLKSKEISSMINKLSSTGVSHSVLLAALTTNPARALGMEEEIGSLRSGMRANFFLSVDTIGDSKFKVTEHWTNGHLAYRRDAVLKDLEGKYNLVVNEEEFELIVKSVSEKGIESQLIKGTDKDFKANLKVNGELITINILKGKNAELLYSLSGKMSFKRSVWDGRGQDKNGEWISWASIRDRKYTPPQKPSEEVEKLAETPKISFPNVAYGWDSLDEQNTFVITNAIVWTCADTGILENADVYVVDGKIKSIGADQLFPSDIRRVDARGRHLTPGIIDEHSHIGLRGGVNEWGQSSSAEVRISDAIDPWNENIYRHLAGGVTSAQLLHGSANPIGGQSAIVKYKWGKSASEMIIDDAPGFIKFALGENVKRSNRKETDDRFPLTRMGVEQTFVDAFTRAREYDPESRVDLDLQAIREILDSTRFISCHSYVQSEILMLMDVAERFDFGVNTFTHVLEGYKIAPELAAHGASGSTFSDWWAYKYEVNDAIPHNAAIMTKAGVNVSINSDDAEMGRRLNQEAAKSIKYGGLSEEEAFKLVTINPAKMLHLDHRTGSIEVGKDADLVLWSDNPLSMYAHAEKTFIEGVKYYDHKDQSTLNAEIAKERARIIAKMQADKGQKVSPKSNERKHYHCDTLEDGN